MRKRDTFDMFDKPDRGRFGDNESRSNSKRVTGASDLIDMTFFIRADTEKAIGVSEARDGRIIWLPKSQIELDPPNPASTVQVTMPSWLAKEKGLV